MDNNESESAKTGSLNDAIHSGDAPKPTPGVSGVPGTSIHLPNGGVIKGGITGTNPSPTDPSARVGDYVIGKNGVAVVVPGSMTDLNRKYRIVNGASEMRKFGLRDYASIAASGFAGSFGLIDSGNPAVDTAGIVLGQVARKNPYGMAMMATIGAASAFNEAYTEATQEFINQQVSYDTALTYERDENGKLVAKIDYKKMGEAGYGSGSEVKKATDMDGTTVMFDGDNKMRVNVSQAFADSENYRDVLETIKEAFPDGITEDQANTIVDEENGKTLLDVITEYIKGEEAQYYYDTQSIKYFKEIAPNASVKALEQASAMQVVGNMKNDAIKKVDIEIIDVDNPEGEGKQVNAEEYIQGISNMTKQERDDYMMKLNSIAVEGKESTDEAVANRAVIAQAQINILYGVSNNKDSGFKDLYRKGFWDSVADIRGPLFGTRFGNWFGSTDLLTFEENDIFGAGTILISSVPRVLVMSRVANGLEKLGRFGLEKTPLGFLSKFAGQDVAYSVAKNGFWNTMLKKIDQVAFQAAADLAYEGMRYGAMKLSGEDMDFWSEYRSDLLMDALVTYGPGMYVGEMEKGKYEYRRIDAKTGKPLEKGAKTDNALKDEQGMYEVKLVRVTADELAARRAKVFDKFSDNRLVLKAQELIADKNAAMAKLAVQVRSIVKGDNYYYRRLIRFSNDLRNVTSDTLDDFKKNSPDFEKNYGNFMEALNEVAPKARNFTKADANYINAKMNQETFLRKNAGDKEVQKKIEEFYAPHINGVDAERAAQLDKLVDTMVPVFKNVLDFYKQEGLISQKTINKLVADNPNYIPVWTKGKKLYAGQVNQGRTVIKNIDDVKDLIDVEDLENPLVTASIYINNAMRNVAINRRALAIRDAATIAGVKIRVVADTAGSLSEVENLTAMREDFAKKLNKIREEVDTKYQSQEDWQKKNDGFVTRSGAFKKSQQVDELKQEARDLRNELRRYQRASKKAGISEEDARKLEEEIERVKFDIKVNRVQREQISEQIKINMVSLLERAVKAHMEDYGEYGIELDIKSYMGAVGNKAIDEALKQPDAAGALHSVINRAVETANPFVSRDTIYDAKAGDAAVAFRKEISKQIIIKDRTAKKNGKDKFNAICDAVMDYIEDNVVGRRASGVKEETRKVRDEEDLTKVLTNYGDSHTIRYMIDGKVHKMVLAGKGSEELVKEFYDPEDVNRGIIRTVGNNVARAKRFLTTSADQARIFPNLLRDWTRGIVTTGGRILLSPRILFEGAIDSNKVWTDEQKARIKSGFKQSLEGSYASKELLETDEALKEAYDKIEEGKKLAEESIKRSTWTQSLEGPRKDRAKEMIKAAQLPRNANGFQKFVWSFKNKSLTEKASALQDAAESYTRKRAMDTAYYTELQKCFKKGMSVDDAIKRATEAAYFYGREATTNFSRRGKLIAKIAEQVPYFAQNFSTLESFKYAYLDNPIAVMRSLTATVATYAALIAIALSNEESRKRYYSLTQYDRANNIIIPLDNGTIITIPLDETIASFLTPYRRAIESLNGVDPQAFYMWGFEIFDAFNPLDFSGFSEGDKLNIKRGFEKLGAQMLPTWALPFLENAVGEDFYFGNNIEIDSDYTEMYYDNPDPTPGELTTKSNNSKILAAVSDATKIPQWKLQTFFTTYGGNVGAYVLNTLDKIAGASEDEQGGKEWIDSVFKPLTGMDSDAAKSALYDGINELQDERKALMKRLKAIDKKLIASTGEEKQKLQEQRQKAIADYGTRVSDFIGRYAEAYEITGGLPSDVASKVYYLYNIYEDEISDNVYDPESPEAYYQSKIEKQLNKHTSNLEAASGLDKYIHKGAYDTYSSSYGKQAFENSIYGKGLRTMSKIAIAFEDTSDYENSFTKLRSDFLDARSKAYDAKDYDLADKLTYEYDFKILSAAYPYLAEDGLEESLNDSNVMKYLKTWVYVPSSEQRTSKGKFVPNLGKDSEKEQAFKKQFIKKMYGVE